VQQGPEIVPSARRRCAGVDVIDGDGADVHELCEVVLVGHLMILSLTTLEVCTGRSYIVSMPGHDVEWAVFLRAAEELAGKLVDNAPALLFDFVAWHRMEEVSSVGKTISSKGTQLR